MMVVNRGVGQDRTGQPECGEAGATSNDDRRQCGL
jgi:hypothetical protein